MTTVESTLSISTSQIEIKLLLNKNWKYSNSGKEQLFTLKLQITSKAIEHTSFKRHFELYDAKH